MYYKTEDIEKPLPVKNNIREELKTQTLPQNLRWSLTISNAIKLNNDKVDTLIALSCFKDKVMISSTTNNNYDNNDYDYEKGDGKELEVSIESRTWVFSVVYNKKIETKIDNIGGVVRFLDYNNNTDTTPPDMVNLDKDLNKLELELVWDWSELVLNWSEIR